MCRNPQHEDAAMRLIGWCFGVIAMCALLAGAFHVGVKQAKIGEGQRCVEMAVSKGWLAAPDKVLTGDTVWVRCPKNLKCTSDSIIYRPRAVVTSEAQWQ